MTVYEILIEAREILKIMMAPSIGSASVEALLALEERRQALVCQDITDWADYDAHFIHEVAHIRAQLHYSDGAGLALCINNKVCAHLLERTEYFLGQIKATDRRKQFDTLIGYEVGDCSKLLPSHLVSFNNWLLVAETNGTENDADQKHIESGRGIIQQIENIFDMFGGLTASMLRAISVMTAHVDHFVSQHNAGDQHTRMSVMDNADGSWDTITDTIVEMANWVPPSVNKPVLTADEADYKAALTNCVEAFLHSATLPGITDDVLGPLRQQLIEHYMDQYKKDGKYLDKPVKELTDFMKGTVALALAASQNIGEHRANIIKSVYANQLGTILDDIMSLKGPINSTLTQTEHQAVCRLMQIVHINGMMACAQEADISLSPATYSVQVGLMTSVLRQGRILLEKNLVKDMFVYRLLDNAILVSQANMYSGGYKHDERTARIKAETFEAMMMAGRDYLAAYFHRELPTLSQV